MASSFRFSSFYKYRSFIKNVYTSSAPSPSFFSALLIVAGYRYILLMNHLLLIQIIFLGSFLFRCCYATLFHRQAKEYSGFLKHIQFWPPASFLFVRSLSVFCCHSMFNVSVSLLNLQEPLKLKFGLLLIVELYVINAIFIYFYKRGFNLKEIVA